MKDKRQRMALSWPFGMVDPSMYSYLLSAAANLSAAQGYHQNRPAAWNFIHPALQVPPALSALQPGFINCPRPPPPTAVVPINNSPLCAAGSGSFPSDTERNSPLHSIGRRLVGLADGDSNKQFSSGFNPYRKLIDPRELENASPTEIDEIRSSVRDYKILQGLSSPDLRKNISSEDLSGEESEKMSSNSRSGSSNAVGPSSNKQNSPGKSFFRPFEEGEMD